jgi:hypothetical protein
MHRQLNLKTQRDYEERMEIMQNSFRYKMMFKRLFEICASISLTSNQQNCIILRADIFDIYIKPPSNPCLHSSPRQMASCATLKDFLNEYLEPMDGNLANQVLATGFIITCLKQGLTKKDSKRGAESKSAGRKILEYMESKFFSGFGK